MRVFVSLNPQRTKKIIIFRNASKHKLRKVTILQLNVHESWHILISSKQSTFRREVAADGCLRKLGHTANL